MAVDGRQVQQWYKEAKDETSEWREEARELYDLVAGTQWTKAEEAQVIEKRRIPVVMNRIAPFVDSILGQQINNRKEIRFLPRETSDTAVADMYTEAVRWADDLCDGEDEVTDAFYDMVVTGMGWTETRMDYAEDPAGMLVTAARVDPLEMYWDVSDSSRNLSKSRWVIRARKWPADEAEEKWPDIKKVSVEWSADEDSMRQPHDATNAWKYEKDANSYYPEDQMYLVLQCQYTVDMPIYRVADPESGQVVTMPPERFDRVKDYLDQLQIKYVKTTQRKYYQCFVCGNELLEKGPAPSAKGFTLQAMTAKRDRNKKSWYGAVRALKDPQKFSNKFFSDMMYIMATNRKGGAFVEEDALVDPRKAEEQWSAPDALIKLNPGGLNKVRERDSGVFPAGLDRLMQYAIDAVPQTSGLNLELVGMADRNQPGILEAQRKQSGLTILAPLFDALKRHQRSRGSIVLDFLHRFVADGRAIRITTPEGDRTVQPLMPAEDADTFDIIVDEMPTTPNSKAETFNVLSQLVPFMAKMGVMPPPEVLDYLPLPATLIEKWRGSLQKGADQPDPAQQAEQMKMQAEQQKMQAEQQMEAMRMQFEREKMQADAMSAQGQAAMKEREMQFEMAMRAQEMQVKQAELELKRIELAVEAQESQQELQQAERSNESLVGGLQEVLNSLAETMGQVTESHRASAESAHQQMQLIAHSLAAPRKVVRDEKGRPIGTEIDGTAMMSKGNGDDTMRMLLEALTAPREVVRDERGRAVGTRIAKANGGQ